MEESAETPSPLGAPCRDRTDDHLFTREVLYQTELRGHCSAAYALPLPFGRRPFQADGIGGVVREARTPDLLLGKQAFCQLNYYHRVEVLGIEPRCCGFPTTRLLL